MRARALAMIGAAIVLVVATSGVAGAASWQFETLDGNSAIGNKAVADVGQFTSTLLYNGLPHTFYRDAKNGTLRHALWTGSAWGFETLDGGDPAMNRSHSGGDVGTDVKTVIFGGQPHVFYYDVTNGDLRHAWWTGAVWAFQTLDGDSIDAATGRLAGDVGTDLSVVNFADGPHAFYRDVTNHSLRHAWWTGAGWARETLDGSGGAGGRVNEDVGAFAAAVVVYGGPHVFYYDDSTTTLRHAFWTGAQWGFETLDGLGGAGGRVNESVGSDVAVTVFDGSPHVWFYDIDKHALRHGWWTGAVWVFETLDGAGGSGRVNTDVGLYSSVTTFNGTPHVFYRAEADGDLRHAWWTGSLWAFESLDGGASPLSLHGGNVGLDSSVTIYNGQPHAFYYDIDSGGLRHAWYG